MYLDMLWLAPHFDSVHYHPMLDIPVQSTDTNSIRSKVYNGLIYIFAKFKGDGSFLQALFQFHLYNSPKFSLRYLA